MKITIIHKLYCPLCERAIREFAGDGHEVELYMSWEELDAINRLRARDMMTDMVCSGGDKDAFPQVFVYDRFIPWKPKTSRKGD